MEVEHPDDIGMGQTASVATLLSQERDLLVRGAGRHHLGDHLGSQILVPRQPGLPHPTPAEVSNQGESGG